MKGYDDLALLTIEDETSRLYKVLASVKPNDDLTSEDIRSLMCYIGMCRDMARAEKHRRMIRRRFKK